MTNKSKRMLKKKTKVEEIQAKMVFNTAIDTFQFPNPTVTAATTNWTISGYEHLQIIDLVYKINEIIRELNKR